MKGAAIRLDLAGPHLLPLEEACERGPTFAGFKAQALLSARRAGLLVPETMVIGTTAYWAYLTGLPSWTTLVAGVADLAAQEAWSALEGPLRRIREYIQSPLVSLKGGLEEELKAAFTEPRWAGPLALRASTVHPDTPALANEVGFGARLGVRSDQLAAACKAVWASAWTVRAVRYRTTVEPTPDFTMALLVQPLLPADYAGSGVGSDANGQVLVEAVAGLGEAGASGKESPQRFAVLGDGRIWGLPGARQRRRVDAGSDGLTWRELVGVPQPCPQEVVLEAAAATVRARVVTGGPAEIEWAKVGGAALQLVQVRPAPPERKGPAFTLVDVGPDLENYPEPLAPFSASVLPAMREAHTRALKSRYGLPASRVRILDGRWHELVEAERRDRRVDQLATRAFQEWPARQARLELEAGRVEEQVRRAAFTPAAAIDALDASLAALGRAKFEQARQRAAADRALERFGEQLGSGQHGLERAVMIGRPPPATLGRLEETIDRLVDRARGRRELERALFADDARSAWITLAETGQGRIFRQEVVESLGEWRYRPWPSGDLVCKSLEEEPIPVLAAIQARLRGVTPRRPAPPGVPPAGGGFLARRRRATALRQSRAAWEAADRAVLVADRAAAGCRRAVLLAGQVLVRAGGIEEAGDAFFLTDAELRIALTGPSDSGLRALVRHRRRIRNRQGAPWGAVSTGVVEAQGPRPVGWELGGRAASPGSVRGRARALSAWQDEVTIQPGEILVMPSASAAWLPLIPVCAGLVTASGSLTAPAITLARALRLPAVTEAQAAGVVVRTGQLVEVDGGAGVVRVLDDGPVG